MGKKIFYINWECLKKGGWSEYLSVKEINWEESGENNILRSVIVCVIYTYHYAYEHITYLITYLLIYLLTYLLHGAESFLRS